MISSSVCWQSGKERERGNKFAYYTLKCNSAANSHVQGGSRQLIYLVESCYSHFEIHLFFLDNVTEVDVLRGKMHDHIKCVDVLMYDNIV